MGHNTSIVCKIIILQQLLVVLQKIEKKLSLINIILGEVSKYSATASNTGGTEIKPENRNPPNVRSRDGDMFVSTPASCRTTATHPSASEETRCLPQTEASGSCTAAGTTGLWGTRYSCYIQRWFICLYLNISLSTHLYQVEIHQGEYLEQGRAVTQQYSDYPHNVFDYQFSGSQFSGL